MRIIVILYEKVLINYNNFGLVWKKNYNKILCPIIAKKKTMLSFAKSGKTSHVPKNNLNYSFNRRNCWWSWIIGIVFSFSSWISIWKFHEYFTKIRRKFLLIKICQVRTNWDIKLERRKKKVNILWGGSDGLRLGWSW